MASYDSMAWATMRTELKKRGLNANGKKDELIERLTNDDIKKNPTTKTNNNEQTNNNKNNKQQDQTTNNKAIEANNIKEKSSNEEIIQHQDKKPRISTQDKEEEEVTEIASGITSEKDRATAEEVEQVQEVKEDEPQEQRYIYLDPELVKIILSFMGNDINNASLVCKEWHQVSKDPMFSWRLVYTGSLIAIQNPISYHLSKKHATLEYFCVDKLPLQRDESLEAIDVEKLLYKSEDSSSAASKFWAWLRHNAFSEPNGLWKLNAVLKRIDDYTLRINVFCKLNTFVFWRLVNTNTVPLDSFLTSLHLFIATEQQKRIFSNTYPTAQKRGVLVPASIPSPVGLNPKLKLYNYQLQAIEWMQGVERSRGTALQYGKKLIRFHSRQAVLYYKRKDGPNNAITYTLASALVPRDFSVCYPKGGVLADEMGLGKTVEVIGLMLASPSPAIQITTPAGPINATLPQLATLEEVADYKSKFLAFLAKSKPKKAGVKRKKKVVEDIDNAEYKMVDLSAHLFRTRATLVICPPHLVGQWQGEIEKHTAPALKVVTFFAIADFGTTTYRSIMEADAVVISSSLLTTPQYFHIGHITPATSIRKDEETRRPNWVKRYLLVSHTSTFIHLNLQELLREGDAALDNVGPVLDHFLWYRIAIDEFHEMSESFFAVVGNLSSVNWWCVSGTPFPQKHSLDQAMKLLGFRTYALHEFMTNFVWRNTKQTTSVEYVLPDLVTETMLLNFTPIEKCAYSSDSGRHRPAYINSFTCFELFHTSRTSLNHIRDLQFLYAERTFKKANTPFLALITPILNSIAQQTRLGIPINVHLINDRDRLIKSLVGAVTYYARVYHTEPASDPLAPPAYFMKHVSDSALAKVIAEKGDLDDIEIETESGKEKGKERSDEEDSEMEDLDAEKENMGKNAPKKKKGVKEVDLNLTDDEVKSVFINYYGTKIGNFLFYLKKLWERDPSARVLVFSWFSDFLERVEKCLNACGIATGRISGSASARTRVISRFKSSEVKLRVLLVNYMTASSGTNLIEASHIFLMHGAGPDRTTQSIARAHRQGQRKNVTVVRFIIKDTIEHEFSLANGIITGPPVHKTNVIPPFKPLPEDSDVAQLLLKDKLPQRFPQFEPLIAKKKN